MLYACTVGVAKKGVTGEGGRSCTPRCVGGPQAPQSWPTICVHARVYTRAFSHTLACVHACARTRTCTPGPEMGPEEVISHTLRRLRINNEPYLDSGVEVIMLLSLTLRYRYFTTLITLHVQLLLRLASYILTLIHY